MILGKTSAETIFISTPAKLNLFLEVRGKRSDGYHEVETVMHSIGLYDDVTIEKSEPGIRFSCDGIPAGPDDENLAFQAARLFYLEKSDHDLSSLKNGVSIHLHKRIPAGAGLGGGSSDAAAVLVGLNELHGKPLTRKRLVRIGSRLGSDVAFFFFCGSALCRGRGERVERTLSVFHYWFSLIYPGFSCSTREVYQNLNLDLTKGKKNSKIFLDVLRSGSPSGIDQKCYNRLQQSAFETTPRLAEIRSEIERSGFGRYSLSGSGSALFKVICENDPDPAISGIFSKKSPGNEPWQVFRVKSSPAIDI